MTPATNAMTACLFVNMTGTLARAGVRSGGAPFRVPRRSYRRLADGWVTSTS
jgi:hypothetical protein